MIEKRKEINLKVMIQGKVKKLMILKKRMNQKEKMLAKIQKTKMQLHQSKKILRQIKYIE